MLSDSQILLRASVIIFALFFLFSLVHVLSSLKQHKPISWERLASQTGLYVAVLLALGFWPWLWGVFLATLAVLGLRELKAAYSHRRKPDWFGFSLLSLFILGSFLLLYILRLQARGLALCIFLFFLTNATDSLAYLLGKMLGKHQILPTISPEKTWEGSVGGVVFCLLFSLVGRLAFLPEISIDTVLCWALGIALSTEFGDAFFSWVKRKCQIKDYGHILPGHGGILDRFDSLIFSTPVFWLLLKFFPLG